MAPVTQKIHFEYVDSWFQIGESELYVSQYKFKTVPPVMQCPMEIVEKNLFHQ